MAPQPAVDHSREARDLLALYDAALPSVYGYLLSRCGQAPLAEELTSETFLAAVGAIHRDFPPPLTTGWLIGVARHKLVDHWRRLSREERGLRLVAGGRAIRTPRSGTSTSTCSAPGRRWRRWRRTTERC